MSKKKTQDRLTTQPPPTSGIRDLQSFLNPPFPSVTSELDRELVKTVADNPVLPIITEALTGWKRARLVVGSSGIMFAGARSGGGKYTASSEAKCEVGQVSSGTAYLTISYAYSSLWGPSTTAKTSPPPTHKSPHKDCQCGFHAARQRDELPGLTVDYPDTACDLEVELSGHYLQYKHGYRAEKQQVISVRIDSGCRACPSRADWLALGNSILMPLCEPCARNEMTRQYIAWAQGSGTAPAANRHFTLAQVAAQLGVHDVRWAEPAALLEGD